MWLFFFWGASISMEISEAPIAPAASHLPLQPRHSMTKAISLPGVPQLSTNSSNRFDDGWVTSLNDIPRTTGNWDRRTRNSGKRIQPNWDTVVVVFFLVGIDFLIMAMTITRKILCVTKGLYFQCTSKLIFKFWCSRLEFPIICFPFLFDGEYPPLPPPTKKKSEMSTFKICLCHLWY